MVDLLHAFWMLVCDLFKSQRRLRAENLFLRHQLNIALRRAPRRFRLSLRDRILLVWMTRVYPDLLGLAWVVKPALASRGTNNRSNVSVGTTHKSIAAIAFARHPTAEWLARQITEAFPWGSAPSYLVRDNDGAYGHVFIRRLQAMGIRDRPIARRSPWQNGYVERFIGTVRRECLDHFLIFGETHLRQILATYAAYYNQVRTHLALGKNVPLNRVVQRSGSILAIPILVGLHHQYVRI